MNLLRLLIVSFLFQFCFGQSGKVVKVLDGDTFILENGIRIRIAEVDCPELHQDFGQESKTFTERQVLYKVIRYSKINISYDRIVAKVWINNMDLTKIIISNGYGWWYQRYSNNLNLKKLQNLAIKKRKGLWAKKAIEPYEYRKMYKLK